VGYGTFFEDDFGTYIPGAAADIYTFTKIITLNFNFMFYAKPGGGPPGAEPRPTVYTGSLTTINASIGTDGVLILNNDITIGSDVVFQPAKEIIVDGVTINGDLIVKGGLLTLDGVTVNGAVLCDNSITLSGAASTINVPDTNPRKAAIILKSTEPLTSTITIRSPLIVTPSTIISLAGWKTTSLPIV
ncbi:unnamed protein product, partial [marine sediment metagenome]